MIPPNDTASLQATTLSELVEFRTSTTKLLLVVQQGCAGEEAFAAFFRSTTLVGIIGSLASSVGGRLLLSTVNRSSRTSFVHSRAGCVVRGTDGDDQDIGDTKRHTGGENVRR